MKRPNITPGEWETKDGLVTNDDGEFVADCCPPFEGVTKSAVANATAIAAMKETLDALEAVMALPANEPGRVVLLIPQIKAALLKAGYTFP